jgi:predicted nucleic acid-binding protein
MAPATIIAFPGRRAPLAILDTNVYIGHWERELYGNTLASVRASFIVRQSSVVLSELRRGARAREAIRAVEGLWRQAVTAWAPTADDWWAAGKLVQTIGAEEGWDRAKRRAFQNDMLIALTARRHGATVVTADVSDFALLQRRLHLKILPAR